MNYMHSVHLSRDMRASGTKRHVLRIGKGLSCAVKYVCIAFVVYTLCHVHDQESQLTERLHGIVHEKKRLPSLPNRLKARYAVANALAFFAAQDQQQVQTSQTFSCLLS